MNATMIQFVREAKYEFLKAVRGPAASVPFLVLPIPLYLFFGVVLANNSPEMRANPSLADYVFAGWCAFAVMMPAIFGVGCGVALERTSGLMKFKRALPTPPGVYLTAKFVMAMAFAAIAVAELVVAALFAGKITMTPGQLLPFAAVMIVGVVPFCAIGLFIGAYSSGPASPAIANLVFLPMIWLSGFFFPLPAGLRPLSIVFPSFHLHQIALGVAGIRRFSVVPLTMTTTVLVAVTIVFGGLAMRRLGRVG
jgi:ABC-2 type transport system permease protein